MPSATALSPAPFSPGNRGLPEQFRAEIVRPFSPRVSSQGAVYQAVRHQAEFHVDSSSVFVLDTLMIPEPLPRRNPELMLDGGGFGLYGNKGKISSVF